MAPQVLSDFVHIGPRTSLYTPPSPIDGELAIICTWLGASQKHIVKYTDLYQQIAPGARILLIESNVPILVSSYARQRKHIQSAVSTVLDTLAESRSQNPELRSEAGPANEGSSTARSPRVVLHAFSNGGTNTATQLLIILRSRLHGPLPLAGLVLDSCPAKGTYWKSYNAMVYSLPKDVATQVLGAMAVHFLLVLLYTWIACGNENPASLMRRTLLDKDTLSDVKQDMRSVQHEKVIDDVGAKRSCYLYSEADAMVEWTDIRDHAEEAARRGWKVEEVRFKESAHCAHLSTYQDRYERAIEDLWFGSKNGKAEREKISSRL